MFGMSEKKIEKWGQKKKLGKLVKALAHSNSIYRAAAAEALGNIDDEESAHALITALRDPVAEVRLNAVISLEKIKSPLAVEHLRNIAKNDEDPEVRNEAARALGIVPKDSK